ncbi:MAG: hypothetical protein ACJ790_14445 [Myxococcaceae bacterium]
MSNAAYAGDWVDTRLSFAFADDNVLAKEGETTPSSPNARFGAGQQNTLFFENVNTKFSGFETLSNLTLYKSTPAFFEGLTTEAALTVLALERPDGTITLKDNSSYVNIRFRPLSWGDKDNITFTGFPVSADRFRLGYAYRITWGGTSAFTQLASASGAPGAKLQLNKSFNADQGFYVFVGAKSALVFNNIEREQATNYGFLGGAGVDVHKWVRIEANGGYFQKGIVPGLANSGIEAPVNQAGGSAQLVFHMNAPIGTSVDLRLYRNDPETYERFFRPEVYDPGGPLALAVSLEGSYLVQTLEDPDVFGRTVPQGAQAAALQMKFKKNYLRGNVIGLYRTVSFIQNEVPGFPPYKDFPNGTVLQPEMFIAGGVDYNFPRAHFTPGVIVGMQQPAAFTGPVTLGGGNPPPAFTGTRTVVMRDVNVYNILPSGQKAEPIISAKATFRWDLSETVAAIGEVYYTRDTNRTTFKDDVNGVPEPTFEKADALGFNTVLQARF